jgi:hypothetical protein
MSKYIIVDRLGENSITPINLTPVGADWGTGHDGNLTVTSGATFNITTNNSGTRVCADGGDGVQYAVLQLEASWAKLSKAPNLNCLKPGDEILLLHAFGSGPNIGTYEFLRVGGVTSDIVYFTTEKNNWYGSGAGNDSNIGTSTGNQSVIIQRVPNYQNAVIQGTLTTNSRMVFRVAGTLSGAGNIRANGTGAGGYGTGGNASSNAGPGANGGGGGYRTNGVVGAGSNGRGGAGGTTFGEVTLSKLFSGSNGGRSTTWWTDPCGLPYKCWEPSGPPAPGGRGGGIVLILGNIISFDGTISSNGSNGPYAPENLYGGAGSGGSVRIEGNVISINNITTNGGTVGSGNYGKGGQGRIAVYYHTSFTGNFTPGYLRDMNIADTPTPTLTPSQTPTITPTSTPAPSGWQIRDYTYDANHPHAVESVISEQSTVGNYVYDENGNSSAALRAA